MKRHIIIIGGFILAVSLRVNGQVTDTLAYIKSIEAGKSKYVGKPFSFLKNNLVLNISVFIPVADKLFDKNAETSTHFWIKNPVYGSDYASFPKLIVYWQTEFNKRKSDSLWNSSNGGYWSARVDSLYGSRIIKDIMAF